MTRRAVLASAFALLMAAVFVRLGVWQLHRLHQRRAWNALVATRLRSAPVAFDALPADSAHRHYRLVRLAGTFDYDHEIAIANRTRNGSPGVELLTPLRLEDGDTAVLVDRGWVYSPDAHTVNFALWREPAVAELVGYVDEFPTADQRELERGDTALHAGQRTWPRLDTVLLRRTLPYVLADAYVVAIPDSAAAAHVAGATRSPGAPTPAVPAARAARAIPVRAPETAGDSVRPPVRRTLPTLSDGPHLSYAIQWFFFAGVALTAIFVLARQERRRTREIRERHPELWSEE
ncbi:MAG TPA: SURF1 family protein [Gemmatimonadaceae bacterium]|nr:SURF1 family protein [Gemmatimonadaceae bacterium]